MTEAEEATEGRTRARWRRWGADACVAAALLVLVVPIMEPLMAHQASRYALTAAVVDHGTVSLDRYEVSLSVDVASYDGELRSDKAPGQPFLAVPAYAAHRALGGEPAEVHRPFDNVGLWAVSTWSAALPAAAIAVLVRRAARRVAPRAGVPAALAVVGATMLLPFASVLFGHVLAGLLLFAAYLCVRDPGGGPWRLLAGGLLMAAAIAVEYPAGLVGPVLLGVAWWRRRWSGAGWYLVGGVVPGALLAAYHWTAFAGPMSFPYEHSEIHDADRGLIGAQLPEPGMLFQVLLGERGLLLLTPVVLAGLVGAWLLASDRGRSADLRVDGVVALVVLGLFIALMAGWHNPTAGASPGPRYVVPALPFLAVGVAEAWRRAAPLVAAGAAVGAVIMAMATLTQPLVPRTETALHVWRERVEDGAWASTLLPGDGAAIAAMGVAAVALAVAAARLEASADRVDSLDVDDTAG